MTTNQTDPSHAAWRKSSRSGGNGDCVEVAPLGAQRMVRDSKNPEGCILAIEIVEWQALVARIRSGDYDL